MGARPRAGRRAIELDPSEPVAPSQLALVYAQAGRDDESRESFLLYYPAAARPLMRVVGRLLGSERMLRVLFALYTSRSGDACGANPSFGAQVLAYLGDTNEMFTCLRRESLERHPWYLVANPLFDAYRDDPRFGEILRAVRLDPASLNGGP